jgi:hypothetical protein
MEQPRGPGPLASEVEAGPTGPETEGGDERRGLDPQCPPALAAGQPADRPEKQKENKDRSYQRDHPSREAFAAGCASSASNVVRKTAVAVLRMLRINSASREASAGLRDARPPTSAHIASSG